MILDARKSKIVPKNPGQARQPAGCLAGGRAGRPARRLSCRLGGWRTGKPASKGTLTLLLHPGGVGALSVQARRSHLASRGKEGVSTPRQDILHESIEIQAPIRLRPGTAVPKVCQIISQKSVPKSDPKSDPTK